MARPDAFVLGLDVGTQSLRAALVDLHGRTVAFGVAPIETTYPRPTWAEQEPGHGGRRPATPSGSALARAATSTRAGRRRSASIARPARSWPATPTASPAALPCSGWISGRSARPTRSARRAIPSSATSRAGSRPSGCCPRRSGSSETSPRSTSGADRIVECTDWMMYRLTGEWTLSLNHVAVKWNYARPDGGWPVGSDEGRRAWKTCCEKWPDTDRPAGQRGRTARAMRLRATSG